MWIRNLLFIGLILSFLGCATLPDPRVTNLETKVAKLEKQVKTAMASGSGAKTIYGFYGLTEGDPALDGINTLSVENGSYAMGIDTSGYWYLYYFDTSSTAAESLPNVVRPNTGVGGSPATSGRWLLAPRLYSTAFYADVFYSSSADLYHYINISNSSAPSFTPSDGDIYNRRDTGILYVYSTSDGAEHIPIMNSKISNFIVSSALQPRHLYGALITNRAASGSITFTLPAAADGMEVSFLTVAAQPIVVNPNDADKFIQFGIATFVDGDSITSSSAAGNYLKIKAVYTGSGTAYDWYIVNATGTWTDTN